MTIEPMKRATLCGLAREKDEMLAALQGLGCLHLVPLRDPAPLDAPDAAARRRTAAAWRHLETAPRRRRPWPVDKTVDFDATIDAALANKERLRKAHDLRDALTRRIDDLEAFGDFELPPEPALRGRKLWFYILPVKERRALDALDLPWAVVAREQAKLYVAVISTTEPPPDLLPVPRVHTGSRALSSLYGALEAAEIEIEQAEAEREELTRSRLILGVRLAAGEDEDDRRAASGMTLDETRFFAVQGWAPAAAAQELGELAAAHGLALRLEDPDPDDRPPTLLKNPGRFEEVGALTSFYMTPDYRAWDPSLIVFASFALFFSMILADAGYAAVLAALVWLFRRKIGSGEAGRRLRFMLFVVLGTAFAYGVAAGSYFGVEPREGGILNRIAFIDVNDFETMMRVSVLIGVLHVCIANGEVAWRRRGGPEIVVRLGWMALTIGGLLLWLGASAIGAVLAVGGLAAVFLASAAQRPIVRPRDWIMRLADGALSLTDVTKLFGDVLSYMRLFALGLASASLAATFNNLAGELAENVAGIGVFLALIVLVFGHVVNLALGILSGVVHGLRLNFIEFFGWGLSDEGYPFKAFARKERTS
ncbi:V-type ATP synthase subunit I [Qingshengfaniella alkalisoli]|uniref:V-type ATP synthase subunit I n=1 Tax=Qingshengfaniella alkalisoli TaxID=2599296 RepID=A0A5B8IZV1_9RHOB|nr:V-type ATP synthase subunit I [Qingshengfaniella alkalisoli]QDY71194.1 V-type ATP synthase subunit I [Qingshengfaniella alkalisoli]